jgi:hypothetical protein
MLPSILKLALAVLALVATGAQAQGQAQAQAQAQDANLLVSHTVVSLGADGLKRTTEFSERVYRRANLVWIERVIPEGAHNPQEHAAGGRDHKHLDVAAAARWITRDERGHVQVKLVSREDKAVVGISSADYGNIGFDGSWPAAYHLIDPAMLGRLKPGQNTAQGQWYSLADKNGSMRVLWSEALQVPLQVEIQNSRGNSRKSTRVQMLAAPAAPAWTQLSGYDSKDYSDFLD